MGKRQIFRCSDCGRKFTPQNQKASEAVEPPGPTVESATVKVASAAIPAPSLDVPNEASAGPASSDSEEVVDHPRY
ncbi:MAG: hypothetical protein WCI73_13020 [Phycisphaerae bacterium]